MRRFLVIAIPVFTLLLFIFIMLSGDFLKRPIGKNDDIPQAIEDLMKVIQNEQWDEVEKKTDELEHKWKNMVIIVQFSSERDEINYFSTNIARLRGATMAKDKDSALIEINEAYEHWNELGN